MYPDEIYNNGKGCKSFQQLLITGVNTWWIQSAKKTWLVWFIYPTFDCTRWAIKGRSKMWKRGTFLSWNRNHFFPSSGKAHRRSRSLNQVSGNQGFIQSTGRKPDVLLRLSLQAGGRKPKGRHKKLRFFESPTAQHRTVTHREMLIVNGNHLRGIAESTEWHFVREGIPENRTDCSTVLP